MWALTIWQPWASLIVGSPPTAGSAGAPSQKPVENRDWRPPEKLIGQQIAIHAGLEKRRNRDAFQSVLVDRDFGPVVPPYRTVGDFPLGAVVGVATLDRVIGPLPATMFYDRRFAGLRPSTIAAWGLDDDGLRWFTGPWGLVFRDRRCVQPVKCGGGQKLWTLPPDIERAVTAQIASPA